MHQIPGLYVVHTEDRGRAVYCSNDINEGNLVEVCQIIVIPAVELPIIHRTVLHDYYFVWGEEADQCAIALGFGSLYNHQVWSNADFLLDYENNTIDIFAIKDIPAGTEITLNYHGESGDDSTLWFDVEE
jgi:uncharacterized protein